MMRDPVLCVFIYLSIGTLIWCFLIRQDIVGGSYRKRIATGEKLPEVAIALASLAAIIAWPCFVPALSRKGIWFAREAKRNFLKGYRS